MNILGIETSCDETAAAVVVDGQFVLSNVIASQIALHQAHGGVVPELAARGHITAIIPVIEAALRQANLARSSIDAIAVTQGPGLAGSLLVGMNVAKALAYALARPLVAVNHLEAHIYANWLTLPDAEFVSPPLFPVLCLLVSGGHTELILMRDHGDYLHLGRTIDDAAGEAFDKGARLLGLGYPGGPAIQRIAERGDAGRFDLPRAWLGDSYDFSFSGLKTALLREVEPFQLPSERDQSPDSNVEIFAKIKPRRFSTEFPVAHLAAAYQEAIVDVLASKTARAAVEYGARTVLLAGGVAANSALRQRVAESIVQQFEHEDSPPVRFPPITLCTDNAAMVAGAAYYTLRRGEQVGWEVDIDAGLSLVDSQVAMS